MNTQKIEKELPRYKCYKEVGALRIINIKDPSKPNEETDGSRILIFAEEDYDALPVSGDWVRKHNPKTGGYLVVYNDGYKSFSPAEAFENGYIRI